MAERGPKDLQDGIEDKSCWTEPLVASARLANSPGIIRGNAVANKEATEAQCAKKK